MVSPPLSEVILLGRSVICLFVYFIRKSPVKGQNDIIDFTDQRLSSNTLYVSYFFYTGCRLFVDRFSFSGTLPVIF